jgi:hypothetical protein
MGRREDNACHRHLFPKALSGDLSGFDVSSRAYGGGMSALEDDQPRFLTCIVDDSWSAGERAELAWAYEAGMSISLLASYLGYSAREVVQELSRQIFQIVAPTEDKKAPRYGAKWGEYEIEVLVRAFQRGRPPGATARELGRDELGVCWQTINTCRPSIPGGVI